MHPWRLPWRPHAYRAALRVSPASKFSERYPSFPPNFTTFGHFLQPTTTWIVLTKPSSALLCKKILAPSKVGLNRKRSDFSDLPNGLKYRWDFASKNSIETRKINAAAFELVGLRPFRLYPSDFNPKDYRIPMETGVSRKIILRV